MKPDFFIVGQPKSGTTALHALLAQHPQIFMSSVKEPEFFASDIWTRVGEGEYRRMFDDSDETQISGEASPNYLFSEVAAQRIADWNSEARIVAILREPMDFLYSYYLQLRRNATGFHEPASTFQQALDLESDRARGVGIPEGHRAPRRLQYTQRVKYREQLERFYGQFPQDQVLVLIYEEFRADNAATMRRICEFLRVDTGYVFQATTENESVTTRSRRAMHAIADLSHGRGVWRPIRGAIRAFTPRCVTRAAASAAYRTLAFGPKSAVDPSLRLKLIQRFRPEVEAISTLLQRDLVTLWEYGVTGDSS